MGALNIDSEEELTRLVQSLINNKAVTEEGSDPNLAFKGILSYLNGNLSSREPGFFCGKRSTEGGWNWETWKTLSTGPIQKTCLTNYSSFLVWSGLEKDVIAMWQSTT